jgi:hypothetical protein
MRTYSPDVVVTVVLVAVVLTVSSSNVTAVYPRAI